MADRIPLIVNPDVSQIQELPASDTLFIANDVDLNGSMDISTALTLSSNATASTRFVVSATTAATNTTSGCATFAGGLGVAGALHVGGSINGNLTGNVTGDVTGNVTGTASKSTTSSLLDESTDTTCFPIFATSASGDQALKTGSNLTFNSNTGALTATKFVGDGSELTGTGAKTAFTHNYALVTFSSTTQGGNMSSYHNGNFGPHLSISLTPSSSNNKIMVASSFQLGRGGGSNNNWVAKAKLTGSGGADLQGSPLVTTNNNTDGGTFFNLMAYDAAGNTSARTYTLSVSLTSNSQSNGDIRVQNAALWAIEMKS